MSEFVKKTLVGYKETPGGSFDSECSHVILTKREYDDLLHEIESAKQDALNTKYESDRKIQEERDAAAYRVQQAENTAQQRLDGMQGLLDTAEQETSYQRGLNANLLRIAKERANADRKLKPKKEHTGYVVVSSLEKEHRYQTGNRRWHTVTLWETVLQSPYSVDFTEEQARNQIYRDLFPEDGKWLVGRIGITGLYHGSYEAMVTNDKVDADFKQGNVLLRSLQHLKANFRAGYWEISFMHTQPLEVVPPDMRAC